jgi:16S rRNA (uracil1498-N3)-methyltransferase
MEVLKASPEGILLSVSEPEAAASGPEPLPDARGSRGKKGGKAAGAGGAAPLAGAAGPRAAGSRPAAGEAASLTPAATEAARAAPGPAAGPGTPPPEEAPRAWPSIILVQSMAKPPAMDLVLRQAAEAGVARVIPLAARRSVVRPGEGGGAEEARGKRARWERVVREGLQQSGSPVPTRIEEPLALAELPERLGPPRGRRLCLLLHEAPLAEGSLHGYLTVTPEEVVLCVGPEGGFAPDEVDFLLAAGFRPLRLPGAVLRAETAALYAVASVETILTERSSWLPPR